MCGFSVATPVGFVARLFARPVHVSATNILARMIAPSVQALAYGMNLDARPVEVVRVVEPRLRMGTPGSTDPVGRGCAGNRPDIGYRASTMTTFEIFPPRQGPVLRA